MSKMTFKKLANKYALKRPKQAKVIREAKSARMRKRAEALRKIECMNELKELEKEFQL